MKKAVLRAYLNSLNSGIREYIESEIKGTEIIKEIRENDSIKIIGVKKPSIKISKKKRDK